MATLSLLIKKPTPKGRITLYVRVYQRGKHRYIRLPFYLTTDDITPKGKFRNKALELKVLGEINRLNGVLIDNGIRTAAMPIDEIVKLLMNDETIREFRLNFFEYGQQQAEKLIRSGRVSTGKSYIIALNAFGRFYGSENLDINNISPAIMQNFTDWCVAQGMKPLSVKVTVQRLQTIFNKAAKEFNDEDEGLINVRRKPFDKIEYPKVEMIEKRALSPETLRLIFNCEYTGSKPVDMAKDVFMMSFMLCGMNTADIYELGEIKNDIIEYSRKKTRGRSAEASHIRITIPNELKGIVEKYKDKVWTQEEVNRYKMLNNGKKPPVKAWLFHRTYLDAEMLNVAVNRGLKELANVVAEKYAKEHDMSVAAAKEELGIEKLQFYAARHSWSTIAFNDCGINSDTIDRCLCHSLKSLATKSYIKPSYEFVDAANRKVIDFVLYGKK